MFVATAAGCDQGEHAVDPSRGPDLRLIASYPSAGQGIDCDAAAGEVPDAEAPDAEAPDGGALDGGAPEAGPPPCDVPINAVIKLRFDRFLKPSTATRQSIRVYSGNPDTSICQTTDGSETGCFFQPSYDVVERVLLYRLGENTTFVPNLLYTVEIVRPGDAAADGLRAFDNAPLSEESPAPLKFQFRTSSRIGPALEKIAPKLTKEDGSCKHVYEEIFDLRCTDVGCHSTHRTANDACPLGQATFEGSCVGVPRMGLDFSTVGSMLQTARGQPAHQTEVSGRVGTPLTNPSRMGVAMPRIDPALPANSYLLYKLLRDPDNYGDCRSIYGDLGGGDCIRTSTEELRRLRNWFVIGDPMPRREPGQDGLQMQQLRDIQRFIADGAHCP